MYQIKQPKKVKAKRRKDRYEEIERLKSKYPILFEGRGKIEIYRIIAEFKNSGAPDEKFPDFVNGYDMKFSGACVYNRYLTEED